MKPFKEFFYENLNKSLDAEYFDAIARNDIPKLKAMVAQAAKSAGYNSQIVYHGTPVGDFDTFKISKSFGSLYFFAKTEEYAKYYANRFQGAPNPKVMEVFLRIENPLKVDKFEPEGVKTAYELRKKGYDSVETPNAYIVFLPDQIKSAKPITKKGDKIIPLSKRFNIESNLLSEYRHNLADGTPTPSLQAHNGKNPNILDKKNLHTVGPYKKKVEKLNIGGSILTFPELEEVGIKDIMDIQLPYTFKNVKNSGADVQVFKNQRGMIIGRVIKASPGLGK